MTQKGDPYIEVFSTLSEVRVLSYILLQLNIPCTSLVKPCYSKMTIHPLFTVYTLRPFSFSPTYWTSSKRSVRYITTFSNVSGVRIVFWILPQLHSLRKCHETILCTKWQFTVQLSPVFPCNGVHGSKKNMPASSLDLNLVNSLLWRVLQQKLSRQDFRDVDCLKCILLHCWVR